jgi:hypothetical protein
VASRPPWQEHLNLPIVKTCQKWREKSLKASMFAAVCWISGALVQDGSTRVVEIAVKCPK